MLRIGTRGSKLALWQAHYTQDALTQLGIESELVIIKTQGDRIQDIGFDKMEGKGFFTKEIEEHLLRGEIDLAVHSMKDMPTSQPDGLCLTAVSYRDKAHDLLLIRPESTDNSQVFKIKQNAVVGTSAARRKAQIKDFRPDVEIKDLRGNVPTRVDKLREGQYDAIFVAAAGTNRLQLDLSDLIVVELNPREFIPAPAQGVLTWQTNANDIPTRKVLQKLHQSSVAVCTNIERTVLQKMDGGCQMPLGVYCERDADGNFHAFAACERNGKMIRSRHSQNTVHGLADRILRDLLV
ncbi:MAG: hydroxymethylbilane synthase [Saprospiraceae bacterium]